MAMNIVCVLEMKGLSREKPAKIISQFYFRKQIDSSNVRRHAISDGIGNLYCRLNKDLTT